jgi:hypothetical protein
MRYHLERWSVHTNNPFDAPECVRIRLRGVRTEDDRAVITSYVASVSGREVTTQSGTVYVLGTPSLEYVTWLGENEIPLDIEHLIRVRRIT